jgi:outer membrane protein assembly factor BamB
VRFFLCLILAAAAFAAETGGVYMIPAEGEGARYWPRWRGPSGQGDVAGKGYVDKWSPTENVLWSVDVPGRGNSSPIVWGDRIFFNTAHEDGKRRSLLSYRRSDGKLLWETVAPDANPEPAYPKNGHASSTPATDGKLIYTYLGNHGLMAVDFNGKIVWRRSFGEFNAYHGTACSPLIYKDRVILYQEQQKGRSFIAAFDKQTGKTLWETERDARVGWNSPVAVHVEDHDEIIVHGMQKVIAYDPATGAELWRCKGNTFEVMPTPVVGHGLVYCSSGRAGPTLAIKPGGKGDVSETNVVWRKDRGSPFVPAPMLVGDILYLINDMTSIASAFDARTGDQLWQARLGEAARESFSAAPIAFDGKVFVTNDNGETFVLAHGREFKLLHINSLNEPQIASPALVDGIWYIRTAKHLWAIGNTPSGPTLKK